MSCPPIPLFICQWRFSICLMYNYELFAVFAKHFKNFQILFNFCIFIYCLTFSFKFWVIQNLETLKNYFCYFYFRKLFLFQIICGYLFTKYNCNPCVNCTYWIAALYIFPHSSISYLLWFMMSPLFYLRFILGSIVASPPCLFFLYYLITFLWCISTTLHISVGTCPEILDFEKLSLIVCPQFGMVCPQDNFSLYLPQHMGAPSLCFIQGWWNNNTVDKP